MKKRSGFVSNSSSSSFVIISAGDITILEDGDTSIDSCGGTSINIDELISMLQDAKSKGVETVDITHGGTYEG